MLTWLREIEKATRVLGTAKTRIDELECENANAWNRVRELESQLKDSRKLREDLKAQLSANESLVKGLQEQIQTLTNDKTALSNTANARLSALLGLRRYLDTLFEKEENQIDPMARPKGLTPPRKGPVPPREDHKHPLGHKYQIPTATQEPQNDPTTGR